MDFHGGIKLPLNHELTLEKPIVALKHPGRVVLLLSQHQGSPAVACVAPGDTVRTFDVVARGMGATSCDVHSSVSGKVEAIGEFPHPHYKFSQGIVIASDGADTPNGEISVCEKESFSLAEIIDASAKCGIVDSASGMLPLSCKLSSAREKPIHYLIISFVQNEPYVHNSETMMRYFFDEIMHAVSWLAAAMSPKFVFLAVPYHMHKLLSTLDTAISGSKDFRIIRVTDKYPQGNESILASCILKTHVKPGRLADANCMVVDASTAFFLYEALKYRKPQIDCYITVSGYGITKPSNVKARVGTPISEIVAQCGGFCGTINSVVVSGLMSGFSQYTLDAPVIKTTSAVTVLPTERLSSPHEDGCMRCKKCIDHCPAYLNPSSINRLSRAGRHHDTIAEGLYSCIECGVCSYICPSRINITHSIILSKKVIMERSVRERELNARS